MNTRERGLQGGTRLAPSCSYFLIQDKNNDVFVHAFVRNVRCKSVKSTIRAACFSCRKSILADVSLPRKFLFWRMCLTRADVCYIAIFVKVFCALLWEKR